MRLLLDTNNFISYLLTRNRHSPVHTVMAAALSPQATLLIPQALLEEIVFTVSTKPYLAAALSVESMQILIETLLEVAEVIPAITDPIPRVTRDPKDDYLLAYAVIGQADYLVTGDRDLLVLGQVEEVRIVSPAQFASLMAP
ncbi:MAG: putative toxin-antitoxin system toxin component, PIN family [Anaerolineae bacterium]